MDQVTALSTILMSGLAVANFVLYLLIRYKRRKLQK